MKAMQLLKSRTIVVNSAFALIITLINSFTNVTIDPEMSATLLAGVNIILRLITTDAISDK